MQIRNLLSAPHTHTDVRECARGEEKKKSPITPNAHKHEPCIVSFRFAIDAMGKCNARSKCTGWQERDQQLLHSLIQRNELYSR